jgi:hypothetical protein
VRATDDDAAADWYPGGFVGREDELSKVRSALAADRSGRASITLIMGEPGIGKTRLADEAAALAKSDGLVVHRGETDASWREPMELWRGVHRSLGLVPFSDSSLPAEVRRWDQLESLAKALAASAPAMVVLEDLHWADAAAIWMLEHLAGELGEVRVAFLATSRDREPDMPRLDRLRRVSHVIPLGGLDVDAVRQLAAAEAPTVVDAIELHARTGGNPLFVQELVRSPHGSVVIGEILQRSLDRYDEATREALAAAAIAGAGTPLAMLAIASSCTSEVVADRLAPAMRGGVLDQVSPAGVRFRHALLVEAAAGLGNRHELHRRLAAAWDTVDGVDARAAAAGHRLRAAVGTARVCGSIERARLVAAELVAAGKQPRAAGLLSDAHEAGAECRGQRELRANVAVDLAEVLSWLGDLEPALTLYQEAAELARQSADPVTRAKTEVGANLWASAFVPDPPRLRRLEEVLETLPPEHRHLRATLLGRLAIVGGADVDASEQVREWADEAVVVARSTEDPVLIAQSLLVQTMSATSRSALDACVVAAEEVVRLAEHAGRSDLAIYGHQRRAGYHLNRGDVGSASQSLGRAEVLAALLPSAVWRQSTLVQRTTLLALSGSRAAAVASMQETVRVGTGHAEPVVVLGCEAMHQMMLLDLYGHADPRAEEVHRITVELLDSVPSPVFQVQKGFGAQLLGDESDVHEVLNRYGSMPELLLRSMTGDHLLRVFADTVARAGTQAYAGPAYRALLPYAGLLNVGGGHSAGLPVDDVLGRLALLDGDPEAALRHLRDAVVLARSMPSSPLLVHCLDHLADTIERAGDGTGDGDLEAIRAEADALAAAAGVARPSRGPASSRLVPDSARAASITRDGAWWLLTSPLGAARLPDSNGLGQLARLLTTPRVEVSAVELAGRLATPLAADLGAGLDARAKHEYRERLHGLQAEIDDAEAAHDAVRGEQAHVEMDALLRELRRAVGLGGRDRPTGSDAERARINVVRSLRRAIAAVADQAPLLGAHLHEAVRTGRFCSYLPAPPSALSWTVRTADGPSASGGSPGAS